MVAGINTEPKSEADQLFTDGLLNITSRPDFKFCVITVTLLPGRTVFVLIQIHLKKP
jgi:hypothetical protein